MTYRREILSRVLEFDRALLKLKSNPAAPFLEDERKAVQAYGEKLKQAQAFYEQVDVPDTILEACVKLAKQFHVEGHRADYIMVFAARACAARHEQEIVTYEHVKQVAPLVLQHRRPQARQLKHTLWDEQDEKQLTETLEDV